MNATRSGCLTKCIELHKALLPLHRGFYHSRHASTVAQRQWSTPLAKVIAQAIETTGPISIANYMRQCLTSPQGGYYTQRDQNRDQFGAKGDFTTSPEISQVFGELVGIWLVAEWIAQGKISSGIEIVEVGPGRGTLMDDLLRTISNFKPLMSSIDSVCLVEASPALQEAQCKLLCQDNPIEKTQSCLRSQSKHAGVTVSWYEDIRHIPKNASKTPFIVAHEFFDAMPIFAFQSVGPRAQGPDQTLETPTGPLPLTKRSQDSRQPQWRELLVTTSAEPSNLITRSTGVSAGLERPEFELTLAKASTPTSTLLPNLSARYKALLGRPGSTIEISPESQSYVAEFADRIGGSAATKPPPSGPSPPGAPSEGPPRGAALIFDYGPSDTVPISTLRGIRSHRRVSPFVSPGGVDLSADVDFTALAEAALAANSNVEVHGPVEQGAWLEAMGIRARADMICRDPNIDEAGKTRVMSGVERLVERGGGAMGRLYKAMAIVPERGGQRPAGFG